MPVQTANVIARVDPQIKEQAEQILSSLGITASNLINML
ncbi:MAG: type II toxin-antitoxin system RelB/DinJ family antitoxin [Desulfovibrio sp.]|nr:type II toxin-antitoxin system RelB/DinJ family antitoxin [Desulfovibrio sp.]